MYILSASVICGLAGVLGVCCAILIRNRYLAYFAAFFVWLVQIILPFGVGHAVQPYVEGGFGQFAAAGPADFTVNTKGYLTYIHTATFYTVFFVTILSGAILGPAPENLVRLSRARLFARNCLTAALCAGVFALCFSLPHLCFMGAYFTAGELGEIGFCGPLLLQALAYGLYYLMTGLTMLTVLGLLPLSYEALRRRDIF